MHTVTSLESTAAVSRPIKGYAVIEVGLQQQTRLRFYPF